MLRFNLTSSRSLSHAKLGVRHNAESSNDNVVFQKTYGDDDYQKARDAECSPLVLHSQPNSTSPKSSHLPRGGYVPDSEFNPSIGNSHSSDFFTLPFIRSQRTPCSNSVPITASVVAEKLCKARFLYHVFKHRRYKFLVLNYIMTQTSQNCTPALVIVLFPRLPGAS